MEVDKCKRFPIRSHGCASFPAFMFAKSQKSVKM